jgi:integrase
VLRLLEAAPGPKHKAALSVAYGAGLRAMEVVALKVCDVDSKRMMIRVEQGKGRKDRHAMTAATRHTLRRHHPRRRAIQYSEVSVIESKSRGVLDPRMRRG